MSIKATLTKDCLDESYLVPTLKDLCLYKCMTNKDILTKEFEPKSNRCGRPAWKNYKLKEPIQPVLVKALLDVGSECMFMMTPEYEKILGAIRMSQPQDLVKLNVSNTEELQDDQLEWLLSGGNVKWLDIHACRSLKRETLSAINKHGSKLEYLRIGDCYDVLPPSTAAYGTCATLKTPSLKILILNEVCCEIGYGINWDLLLRDVMKNLEELQIRGSLTFNDLHFLERATGKMTRLTLSNCKIRSGSGVWEPLFKLQKLKYLDVTGTRIGDAKIGHGFVHRTLSTMTKLTHLFIDPGVVRTVSLDKEVLGQGSKDKRLEVLGLVDKHDEELGKANILAKSVVCFGSFENELRVLEYFSNRLNLKYYDPMILKLLRNINADTSNWQSVTVLSSLMKILKNNSVSVIEAASLVSTVRKLITSGFHPKIGEVLTDQLVYALCSTLERSSIVMLDQEMARILCSVMDILFELDEKLSFNHYTIAVPLILGIAKKAVTNIVMRISFVDGLRSLLRSIARLFEMAVARFSEQDESATVWGIESVIEIIGELPLLADLSLHKEVPDAILESIGNMIDNLKILCQGSDKRMQLAISARGIDTMFELVMHFVEGSLRSSDRVVIPLLDIMESILQHTTLDKWEFGKITICLEKTICFYNQNWDDLYYPIGTKKNDCSNVMKMVICLLRTAENHPLFEYQTDATVNKRITKINSNLS